MKQILPVAGLIIVFIVFALFTNNFLYKSSDEIIKSLDKVETSISKKDWTKAKIQLKESEDKWDKIKNRWSMLIDHQEIDKIELSLNKAHQYVKTQNLSESLSETANLKLLLGHIPMIEKLNIKNVL